MRIPVSDVPPSKEDYESALKELISGLKSLNSKEVYSLLVYGSFAKGTLVLGRSDIDLCLILKNTITDKGLLLSLGEIIKKIVKEKKIPIELGIYDINIAKDGRFFTYGKSFEEEFKKSKIVYGEDPRKEFNLKTWFHEAEQTIGFNLRWLRKKFVEALYYIETDYNTFTNNFGSFLVKMKNIKKTVKSYIRKELSNSSLEEILSIASDFNKFNSIRKEPELALDTWKRGLTSYEEIILEIIKKYPGPES